MLNEEQMKLIKENPIAFFRSCQGLYPKLMQLVNELEIENKTGGSEEKKNELSNNILAVKNQRQEIYDMIIKYVPDNQKQYILCAHYLQGKSLQEIAESFNVTRDWILRLQRKAALSFSEAVQNL